MNFKKKYKLVRFAHNWNDGILEHWNIGFWENGKLNYGKIPLYGNQIEECHLL
jgi:hypothetical protein